MDRELLANRRACDSHHSAIERAAKRPRRAQVAHHRRMEEIVDITMDSPEAHPRAKEPQSHPGSDYRSSSRLRNPEFRALWGEAGPGPSQVAPPSSEEPIRWNRHRRRSSSRAARPSTETPSGDDDVIICPPPDEAKYQQADECTRESDVDPFGDCSPSTAFNPLSLSSFGSRHPPSLPAAPRGTIQTSRWVGAPQPRQHDAPPTPLERTTSPAVYQSLPYRTRNHRPFEPFDTALHHHSTRSTAHAPEPGRQEHGGNAVHRRSTRDTSQQGSLEVLPPPALPRRHFRRTPTSEELAERIADRRRREEARAAYNTRALEEAELRFRMEELEALEAAFGDIEAGAGPPGPALPLPPPPGRYTSWHSSLPLSENAARPRTSEGRGRRRGWGPGSLAEAMMGVLGEDAMLGSGEGRLPQPPNIAGHLSAMRAAFAGMSSGRLPPHLLFSDRDFNEDDYEALLALDDTVENRKGASKEVIEAIATVAVPVGGLTATGDRRCPICLEDYVSGATLRHLQCSHQFHKPCLDKWLEQKATCPICQGDCNTGCNV